jgi:hypothetical protein
MSKTLRPDDQLILEFYPGRVLFGRTLSARFGEALLLTRAVFCPGNV